MGQGFQVHGSVHNLPKKKTTSINQHVEIHHHLCIWLWVKTLLLPGKHQIDQNSWFSCGSWMVIPPTMVIIVFINPSPYDIASVVVSTVHPPEKTMTCQ